MNKPLHFTLLALAIGSGVGSAWAAANADSASANSATASARATYIITFTEEGAVNYQGGVQGLRGTSIESTRKTRFDAKSSDVASYRNFLKQAREDHLQAIHSRIGRDIDVTHVYEYTENGIAADLTAAEAAAISRIPGVASVVASVNEHLDTYRGPGWIGAGNVWGPTPATNPAGTGAGVKIAIIDSGANSTHPSFANDPACGFSASNPKFKAVSCATATGPGGACNGPNPEADSASSGHGVHTASTAGGNVVLNSNPLSPGLLAPYTQMSGVAPCATVYSYKVCNNADGTCSTAHTNSAINNAIADGVDVINFSISGGTNPWNAADNDRTFLNAINAGIFVAASAGNTSTTVTNPVGQVNHRGPWMMTVAASTHDQNMPAIFSATGPGTPPAATVGVSANKGGSSASSPTVTGGTIKHYAANLEGCTASGGFPANYFAGAAALIRRGTCAFTEKIQNAGAAGASLVIIANNQAGVINMATTGFPTPSAYSIDQTPGDALIAFVNASGGSATFDFTPKVLLSNQGDVLADFSFRGPTPGAAGQVADLTKPDITAPGVNIYAAVSTFEDPLTQYGQMSGTSMSGPHVAGAGALVTGVRREWSPAEIKSALQMTARMVGTREDGTTPWDHDDVGSGLTTVDLAVNAGFVLDETFARFLAANPSGGSINVKTLNLASARNASITGNYSWTRTLKNTLPTNTTWNVTVEAPAGVTLAVSPTSFSFNGTGAVAPYTVFSGGFDTPVAQETQDVTITATMTASSTTMKFGRVIFTEASGKAPTARITVAVKGNP